MGKKYHKKRSSSKWQGILAEPSAHYSRTALNNSEADFNKRVFHQAWERVLALFEHYGIDHTTKIAALKLIICLAKEADIPAFSPIRPKKVGRPKKHGIGFFLEVLEECRSKPISPQAVAKRRGQHLHKRFEEEARHLKDMGLYDDVVFLLDSGFKDFLIASSPEGIPLAYNMDLLKKMASIARLKKAKT